MNREKSAARRRFLTAGVGLAVAGPVTRVAAGGQEKIDPEAGVTAPEDLMKEHGVLNRCLLIYEEGMRRLRAREAVAPEVFQHTAKIYAASALNYLEVE